MYGGMTRKRMIVSLSLSLTSPESLTPSISTLFWTSLLSLFIAVLISFFKNITMVRAFPFHRGFYSFPLISAIFRQSRISRKDSDLREFVRVTGASYASLFTPLLSTCILKSAYSSREARRYLDKHLRLDIALQSYTNNRENAQTPSSSTDLEKIFNKYKGVQFVLAPPAHRFLTRHH